MYRIPHIIGFRAPVAAAFLLAFALSLDARAEGAGTLSPGGREIAPIPNLIARVESTFPGRILKVEVEGEETPFYEVKLLGGDGAVLILYYNAVTLSLDRIQGRYRNSGDGNDSETANVDDTPKDDDDDSRDDDDDDDSHDSDDDDSRDDDRSDDDSGDPGGDDSGSDDSGSDDSRDDD